MIIGNGLLASAFGKDGECADMVVVASGISNSAETRVAEFERERSMLSGLFKLHKGKVFVYFSSCALIEERILSIPYYRHKLEMENYIKQNVDHLIVRLPQLIGRSSNQNTIINAFRQQIANGIEVLVQKDAYRYFIDVYDVVSFVRNMHKYGEGLVVDFANPFRYSAESVLLAVATSMGIVSPKYRLVDGGIQYELDFKLMFSFIEDKNIYNFGPQYLDKALAQYEVQRQKSFMT